jgi:ketosteroid isomerase-like protein
MPEVTLDLVREGYEAMGRRDIERLVELAHPEIEWMNPAYAIETGTRHGHDGYRKALANTIDAFDELHFELEQIIEVEDDRFVVTGHWVARGKGSGVELRQPFGDVHTYRDGLLIRYQWFNNHAEALAAAGVDER